MKGVSGFAIRKKPGRRKARRVAGLGLKASEIRA